MSSSTKLVIGIACLLVALGLGATALFTPPESQPLAASVPELPKPAADSVVIAAKDIRRGQRIAKQMLTSLDIAEAPPPGAFRTDTEVVGGIALVDIRAGQLVQGAAVLRDDSARPGLSVLVPPGKRAVALRVNDEVAVGNFVRPEDRVDIELVIPADRIAKLRGEDVRKAGSPESRILLQKILVLSVGEALTTDQDNRAIRMQNLTVAVTPEEALLLALAKQVGNFYLALRHPFDQRDVRVSSATTTDLLGSAAKPRKPAARRSASRPQAPSKRRVLIIQGTKERYETVR